MIYSINDSIADVRTKINRSLIARHLDRLLRFASTEIGLSYIQPYGGAGHAAVCPEMSHGSGDVLLTSAGGSHFSFYEVV